MRCINIPLVIGETVKVIDGPFNGFNGNVEKINEEKRKLEVMVKIFGRKTPLELSYHASRERFNCYSYNRFFLSFHNRKTGILNLKNGKRSR